MNEDMNTARRGILRLLVKTTVITLVILALAAAGYLLAPVIRAQCIDSALEHGDTDRARRLAAALDEDAQREVTQQCSYIEAQRLMDAGQYREASQLFADAGDHSDASQKRRECDYARACELEQTGDYDAAIELYRALGAYADAADRIVSCRYASAAALAEGGDKAGAAMILSELKASAQAQELLHTLVRELTGIDDIEKALAAFRGMSEEELEQLNRLADAREAMPKGILDIGFYHIAGLGADGRVYAAGDNSFGQCDTGGWKDTKAVACGAWHTAALLSDGTVVCTGRGSEGQCDTDEWHDIVAIAAGDYATFGLCVDGTVVSTGFLDYESIREWSDITEIYAGSYGVAGLRRDGSLWLYPVPVGADRLENAYSAALSTGYAVCACTDGSVICSAFELTERHDVLTVSASPTAILALTADGRVEAHFFRAGDAVDFSAVSDAVYVAAGSDVFALVRSDGSVELFGAVSDALAEVQSWTLAADK